MLKAMAARVHTSEARVRQWMTADPITASVATDVEDAARIMLDNGFRHLPVPDETGRVTGIASLRRVVALRKQLPTAPDAQQAAPVPRWPPTPPAARSPACAG